MMKYFQNLLEKVEKEHWSLSLNNFLFFLLLLLLPTQLGLHFWPTFSYLNGIRVDYLSPTLYLTDLIIIFLITLNLNKINFNKPFFVFTIILLLMSFPNFLVSENKEAFFYGLIKLIEIIFLGFIIKLKIKQNLKLASIGLSVGVIFESLLSVLQILNQGSINGIFYFFGERFYNSYTPNIANASLNGELFLRPYGTFSHPNVLAFYLLFSMTIILLFIKTENKILKTVFLLSILIGTFTLTLSLSRLPIILWIFFCFIIMFLSFERNLKIFISALFLIIAAIFTFTIFKYRLSFLSIDDSLNQRVILYSATFKIISKNLIFGIGLNNYYQRILPLIQKSTLVGYPQPVHNIFLLIFAETGIGGLTLLIVVFLRSIRDAIWEIKFLLISIIVLGFFDHYFLTIQQGQILLAVSLGLGFAKITRKDIQKLLK